jgi:hypothetical protein
VERSACRTCHVGDREPESSDAVNRRVVATCGTFSELF